MSSSNHSQAHSLFVQGQQLLQQNQIIQAEQTLKKAIQLNPKLLEAYNLLAQAYQLQNKHAEVLKTYQKLLVYVPNNPTLYHGIGLTYLNLNDPKQAIKQFQKAIKLAPQQIESLAILADIYRQKNEHKLAITYYEACLKLQPQNLNIINQLGILHLKVQNFKAAIELLSSSIQLNPQQASIHNNLGICYSQLKQYTQAEQHFNSATLLAPDMFEAYDNLFQAMLYAGKFTEVIEACRLLTNSKPEYIKAYKYAAMALGETKHISKALQHYKTYIEMNPEEDCDALLHLGALLLYSGQAKECIATFNHAYKIMPTKKVLQHNIPFYYFVPDYNSQAQFREAKVFQIIQALNKEYQYPLTKKAFNYLSKDASKRLKIGYLSPDFKNHSASGVFEILFKHHDSKKVELFAYSNTPHNHYDDKTEEFKNLSDHWRDISDLSDQKSLKLIENDKIDILVDLAGLTLNHRINLFIQKAAPIQVSGLGYGRTTGVETIDYLISDPYIIPPQRTNYSKERIFYISSVLRWSPPDFDEIPIAPLPLIQNQYPIFGCGNQHYKRNTKVIEIWSQILKHIPQAKIYLKSSEFDEAEMCTEVLNRFKNHGVSAERVKLFGRTSKKEHIQFYNSIDIALDPFPCNGGITVCEAAWMGIPTIALKGGAASGATVMSLLGLPELAGNTFSEYITLAIQLANNPDKLQSIRKSLRLTLLNSTICNGHNFAREMENAYQMMWLKWLKT